MRLLLHCIPALLLLLSPTAAECQTMDGNFKTGTSILFTSNPRFIHLAYFPEVVQVIDANNMLVRIEWQTGLDERNRPTKDSTTVWVEAPTKDIVDNQKGVYGGAEFEVVGTKRYGSA